MAEKQMYEVNKKLKSGGSINFMSSKPLAVAKHNKELENKKAKGKALAKKKA